MTRYAKDSPVERRANDPPWSQGKLPGGGTTGAELQSLSISEERQKGRRLSDLGTAWAKLYKPGTLLISMAGQERVR